VLRNQGVACASTMVDSGSSRSRTLRMSKCLLVRTNKYSSMGESAKAERMTFTVPGSVKARAQARGDVNWSAVVSKAIEQKLASLEIADRIAAGSKLTQEDVDEVAEIVDEAMAKHFGASK
jgi:hypothetical protein